MKKYLLLYIGFFCCVFSYFTKAQSFLNITDYPHRFIEIKCVTDYIRYIDKKSDKSNIQTEFIVCDNYYKYVDVCSCTEIFGIDFTREILLIICEAEGYNNTNISSSGTFVIKDIKRKKIICVVNIFDCYRWDYSLWGIVGVVIPDIPYGYSIELQTNYVQNSRFK